MRDQLCSRAPSGSKKTDVTTRLRALIAPDGTRSLFEQDANRIQAGAIGGMAVALLSGREDWRARTHYFAFLGAVGFGFGGE